MNIKCLTCLFCIVVLLGVISCGKKEQIYTVSSQSFSAEHIRSHSLTSFDPDDLEIRAGRIAGTKRTIVTIEGCDSAGLDLAHESILIAADIELPADQPGHFTIIADISNETVGNWLIRRGIPFIEKDTTRVSAISDSTRSAVLYSSNSEKHRFYIVNWLIERKDFPELYVFWGARNVKIEFIDSRSTRAIVDWSIDTTTNEFQIEFPNESSRSEKLKVIK